MDDDDEATEEYVCKEGYVFADCPKCGYTNEVQEHATPQQVESRCERCNLPEVVTSTRMLSEEQVSEIVASSVASACQKAADIATATNKTDWSLAELGAMIAGETVSNTFGALFAEEEYRCAYAIISKRARPDADHGETGPEPEG